MGIELLESFDLKSIKGILWDLDDTLYDYQTAHQAAYVKTKSTAFNKYQISNQEFDFHWEKARKSNHHQLNGQAASHSRLLYLQKLHEQLYGYSNADFAIYLEEVYWSHFLNNMQWKKGIEKFLFSAKDAGISMAIVTDLTAHIQLRKWIQLDLGRFMNFMVSSEEAGKEKPESDIFLMALQKLNLQASEVIIVGDNINKDIQGAERLNIQSILIK